MYAVYISFAISKIYGSDHLECRLFARIVAYGSLRVKFTGQIGKALFRHHLQRGIKQPKGNHQEAEISKQSGRGQTEPPGRPEDNVLETEGTLKACILGAD